MGGVHMEQWRDIPGYEGIYQASNMGNVRTCDGKTTYTERHGVRHWKQRILKPKHGKRSGGKIDLKVDLWKDGKEKTYLVSRLIGLAWCAGYADGMTINHINGNPLDNRAVNLEWVTIGENIRKGFDTGLFANSQHSVQLRCDERTVAFASMAEASRFLGRNPGYIFNCQKKKRAITSADGTIYEIVGASA